MDFFSEFGVRNRVLYKVVDKIREYCICCSSHQIQMHKGRPHNLLDAHHKNKGVKSEFIEANLLTFSKGKLR